MSYFTETTREKFRKGTGVIKSSQEQFIDAYLSGCKDVAGNDFLKGADLERTFKLVQEEAKVICVDEEGASPNTFYNYCQAARKCLVFNVPWSFARRFKINELATAKKLAESFKDGTPEERMMRAFSQIKDDYRIQKQKEKVQNGMSNTIQKIQTGLPMPENGESKEIYAAKVFQSVKNHLESGRVRHYLEGSDNDSFGLRSLLNICRDQLSNKNQ